MSSFLLYLSFGNWILSILLISFAFHTNHIEYDSYMVIVFLVLKLGHVVYLKCNKKFQAKPEKFSAYRPKEHRSLFWYHFGFLLINTETVKLIEGNENYPKPPSEESCRKMLAFYMDEKESFISVEGKILKMISFRCHGHSIFKPHKKTFEALKKYLEFKFKDDKEMHRVFGTLDKIYLEIQGKKYRGKYCHYDIKKYRRTYTAYICRC